MNVTDMRPESFRGVENNDHCSNLQLVGAHIDSISDPQMYLGGRRPRVGERRANLRRWNGKEGKTKRERVRDNAMKRK